MKVSLMLVLVLLLYLVSSIGHLYVMLTDRRKLFTFILICLISGFVIHGILLASSLSLFQSKGVGFWFSGISWVILLFYLLLYAKYKEIALILFIRSQLMLGTYSSVPNKHVVQNSEKKITKVDLLGPLEC